VPSEPRNNVNSRVRSPVITPYESMCPEDSQAWIADGCVVSRDRTYLIQAISGAPWSPRKFIVALSRIQKMKVSIWFVQISDTSAIQLPFPGRVGTNIEQLATPITGIYPPAKPHPLYTWKIRFDRSCASIRLNTDSITDPEDSVCGLTLRLPS
jgi:hypothetical protein